MIVAFTGRTHFLITLAVLPPNELEFVCLFDLMLYVPSTIFQLYRDESSLIFQLYRDESSLVEPVLS